MGIEGKKKKENNVFLKRSRLNYQMAQKFQEEGFVSKGSSTGISELKSQDGNREKKKKEK